MRVLVVLALFSVCNANVLWQDAPKSNLDLVKDAFWDYVAKATQTSEDLLSQIRQSELGQDMNSVIAQSADTVDQYVVALRSQVAPLGHNFMTQLSQEAERLKARLAQDLSAVSDNVQPLAREVVANLQSKVEELRAEVAPYTSSLDAEALKAVVLQKSNELKQQLDQSVSRMQAHMVPYSEEVKQKMEQSVEEFQRSVIPLTQSFEVQLSQKTLEVQQSLVQRGEQVRASLDASTQDLQTQLAALWKSFTKTTQ